MTMNKKVVIGIGVVVVGVGAGVVLGPARPQAHPLAGKPVSHQKATPKKILTKEDKRVSTKKATMSPPKTPVIPSAEQSSGTSAQASLAAITQKEGVATPSGPIDVVANLANPTQTWAFATEAAHSASTGYTLWFGEQDTPHGPWAWIPSTLPGALSSKLPPAVYSALQWAWDLNQGQPGPTLFGTVSWNGITGHVGLPEGWTAQESEGQLTITTWAPSYTGTYAGFYGVQSAWHANTMAAGKRGLSMIVPGGAESLDQLVSHANL
ncbi:hypothetical protein BXT84_00615 [Sulfobacillus thermotolerans]|uniref:Uncharacterized protein n=1 Tax=Sulfobacillus thermotolerans TaxID=338644 RepID=A0ABN5GW49_9FIRM|nr:hypothetical protein BXT84_00615 [Sulfobacillus thermotolerans]